MGYQRSTGTFVSPNICGIIVAIASCALLYTDPKDSFRRKYVWGTLLIGGLLTTFSRSSMLGFAVATGFCILMAQSWRRLSRRTVKRCLLIVATVAAGLILDQILLDGLFIRMFLSTVIRTFNGEDFSANVHLRHLFSPPIQDPLMAETIPMVTDPTGPGILVTEPSMTPAVPGTDKGHMGAALLEIFGRFGKNGPMAEEFLEAPYKVESSFYLMRHELGTFGALVYFAPYLAVILQTILCRRQYPYFVPAAVSAAVLVSYVFLPNVQTFEVPFYCFLFMGLYCNPSVKKLFGNATGAAS